MGHNLYVDVLTNTMSSESNSSCIRMDDLSFVSDKSENVKLDDLDKNNPTEKHTIQSLATCVNRNPNGTLAQPSGNGNRSFFTVVASILRMTSL